MNTARFKAPVHVLTGLGFVRTIENAAQAHAFVMGLAITRRHALLHAETLEICRRALRDEASVENARRALVHFAGRLSILVTEDSGSTKRAA